MSLFSYQSGNSPLHRMHPLTRLSLFICLIVSLGRPGVFSLGLVGVLLITAHIVSCLRLRMSWRNGLFFLFLIALVFWGEYRQSGLLDAFFKSGGFLLTLYASLIFTALSDPMDLGETLYRLTRPIPFFPAGQLMTLLTLTLSFIPLIGEESSQLRDALNSRSLHKHPSPFRRVYYHSMPLMAGVIRRSDEIARALYARCYRPDPQLMTPSLKIKDFGIIAGAVILPVLLHFLTS